MVKRRFDERNRLIADRRIAGASVAELSDEFGKAPSTIWGILQGQGVIGERGAKRTLRFCAKPDCGKVIWRSRNGKYCSEECWRAEQASRRGRCALESCGKPMSGSRNSMFCSRACYWTWVRAANAKARGRCANPGCTNVPKRAARKYCSVECSQAHRTARAFKGNPCAHPRCLKFTTTHNQKYCSAECRMECVRVFGGATDQREERDRRRWGRKCAGCGCSIDDLPLASKRCLSCSKTRRLELQRIVDRRRKAKKRAALSPGRPAA